MTAPAFRVAPSIRRDPRLLSLHAQTFRHWFMLSCYAAELDRDGSIGRDMKAIGVVLGLRPFLVQAVLDRLGEAGLMTLDEDGYRLLDQVKEPMRGRSKSPLKRHQNGNLVATQSNKNKGLVTQTEHKMHNGGDSKGGKDRTLFSLLGNDQEVVPPPIVPPRLKFAAEFDEAWQMFPAKRKGARDKAYQAFLRAVKRASVEDILDGIHRYRFSVEVERGFAKGMAAWLNDDRWCCDYEESSVLWAQEVARRRKMMNADAR